MTASKHASTLTTIGRLAIVFHMMSRVRIVHNTVDTNGATEKKLMVGIVKCG